jgi:hypothetical protein
MDTLNCMALCLSSVLLFDLFVLAVAWYGGRHRTGAGDE